MQVRLGLPVVLNTFNELLFPFLTSKEVNKLLGQYSCVNIALLLTSKEVI